MLTTYTPQQVERCLETLRESGIEPLVFLLNHKLAERQNALDSAEQALVIYRLQGEIKAFRELCTILLGTKVGKREQTHF